ncbi:hypothetical protein [Thermotoga sp. KOL6]|uniref:hypothetical protein n=1 Tax=Thermotoga sp. KOL6 TaxID=126741 RepID=UPI000C7602DD|nr:hypothetical protein [Thermotoga sp. KOL6]PLV60059.1 hypothetical protein AS005_01860 [Thermotoga sp. KOL6]
MELIVNGEELKNWVYLLDKLVGTTEPSARFISFFFREGLWISASDNCASLEIFLGKIPKFEGSRIVSLDLVKFFLSDIKVKELHITISQDRLALKAGSEILDVKCKVGEVPQEDGEERFLCTLVKREFESALNFSSANLDEGEFLILLFEEKDVFMFGPSSDVVTFAQISAVPRVTFSLKIPYVTVRHVFKALQKLNIQTLDFYEKEDKLVVKYPRMIMKICGDKVSLEEQRTLESFLNAKTVEELVARKDVFSKLVRKAAVLSKGSYATLSRIGEVMRIMVKQHNLNYTAELFVEPGKNFVVVFPSKKLRSVLARLESDKVILEITEEFLKISNSSRTRIAFLELEKLP